MKPEGWHTITPRLVADDPARLVAFLVDAFGAAGEFRSEVPSILRLGDSHVMVSGSGTRAPTSSLLYLYVDDADEAYARALAAGATSIEEPCDTPYGDRRAMVADPSGNEWQLATYSG